MIRFLGSMGVGCPCVGTSVGVSVALYIDTSFIKNNWGMVHVRYHLSGINLANE